MQDFTFATLLFAIYFCFVSCLIYKPNKVVSRRTSIRVDRENFVTDVLEMPAPAIDYNAVTCTETPAEELWEKVAITDVRLLDVEEEPQPEVVEDSEGAREPAVQSEFYNQAAVAIEGLGKRQARRLCSPLGIQQKCNGVELSTQLMVAAIKKAFRQDPDKVIAVIGERLPEVLLSATDQAVG
jgi:hypothetical protein